MNIAVWSTNGICPAFGSTTILEPTIFSFIAWDRNLEVAHRPLASFAPLPLDGLLSDVPYPQPKCGPHLRRGDFHSEGGKPRGGQPLGCPFSVCWRIIRSVERRNLNISKKQEKRNERDSDYERRSTRDSATEHISHIRDRDVVGILENHGINVQMLTTDRVGYVVYEDEFQIVAEPFDDSY